MKVKAFLNNYPLQVLSFILAVVFTAIMSHYNWQIAVAQVCFIALISIAGMVRTRLINEKLKRAVKKTANYLDFSQKNSLDGFPFPVIVAEDNGKILWCNDLFYKSVIEDKQLQSDSVEQFIGANLAQLSSTDNYLIEYNEKNIHYIQIKLQ